jgi:uncharacterized protein
VYRPGAFWDSNDSGRVHCRPVLTSLSPDWRIEYDPTMTDPGQRGWLLRLAVLFEGGLVLLALVLAWLFRVDLVTALRPGGAAILAGVLGAVPPFLLLVASDWLKIPALERIKRIVLESLGPPLAACRWYDLIVVAALAGFGEELLFRGVVQRLCERWLPAAHGWNLAGGLILPNVVFALLHLITPTYALLAGAMGVYFGILLNVMGPSNLLAPILAHGFYDYWGFLIIVRTIRRGQSPHSSTPPSANADVEGPAQSAPPS